MTPFKAGDVVAVEFPFSDLQTYKRRPGLVLVMATAKIILGWTTGKNQLSEPMTYAG